MIGATTAALLLTFTGGKEGKVLRTYRDAVGVLTSCYGHTGPELHEGQTWTEQQCNDTLIHDLTEHAEGIAKCTHVLLTDGEALAYVDFAFNFGVEAFCNSTLARKLNAGDRFGACAELDKWVNAGGKPLKGLIRRRAEERTYCERDL